MLSRKMRLFNTETLHKSKIDDGRAAVGFVYNENVKVTTQKKQQFNPSRIR